MLQPDSKKSKKQGRPVTVAAAVIIIRKLEASGRAGAATEGIVIVVAESLTLTRKKSAARPDV